MEDEIDTTRVEYKYQLQRSYWLLAKEAYKLSQPNRKTPYIGVTRRRQLFAATIFSALMLEVHINDFLAEYLPHEWPYVDRLPTTHKWYMAPVLLGKEHFDVSAQPFQSIKRIFTLRDKLVHFKPQYVEGQFYDDPRVKDFTHEDVRQLMAQSRDAMRLLYRITDIAVPEWLEND